jgi:hypothetical protein
MTVLSRGGRVRRGGRRPGWVLLTALLVLAIGASSALVFTDRVELLKLAVILALWAAVAGAFVSVLYRRQSDADQSRVRDLKLVYDLQLDREISAGREYELTVESQLRRELASELRAQAADDVAVLRAELAALRTSLEILFDTDLEQRPALETLESEPTAGRPVDWVASDRPTSVRQDNPAGRADESAIIDVPEEPLLPPRQPPPAREPNRYETRYEAPFAATPIAPPVAPPPPPPSRDSSLATGRRHRPPQNPLRRPRHRRPHHNSGCLPVHRRPRHRAGDGAIGITAARTNPWTVSSQPNRHRHTASPVAGRGRVIRRSTATTASATSRRRRPPRRQHRHPSHRRHPRQHRHQGWLRRHLPSRLPGTAARNRRMGRTHVRLIPVASRSRT